MKPNIARIFVLLLASALLLVGCQDVQNMISPKPTDTPVPSAQKSDAVVVEGRIVPKDTVNLFFTAPGKVDAVLVTEGGSVKKGDVLARLGDRQSVEASVVSAKLAVTDTQQAVDDLNKTADLAYQQSVAEVVAAERAVTDAQQKLDDLDTDDYQKKIDDADTKVNDTKDELKTAQEDFDKYKDLDKDNTNRKNADTKLKDAQKTYNQAVRDRDRLVNDRDKVRSDYALTQANLADLTRTRDDRKNGPDPEKLALAQAQLDNAKAQLAAAEAALDQLDLKAPYDGVIVRLDISAGEKVLPNQTVMVIADFSAWYVETNDLTENEVVRINSDKTVTVEPDAIAGLVLTGKIESISHIYTEKSGDITYKTKILLTTKNGEALDERLRWGMTVQVKFPQVEP